MKDYALFVVLCLSIFTFGLITFVGGYTLAKYTYEQGESKSSLHSFGC